MELTSLSTYRMGWNSLALPDKFLYDRNEKDNIWPLLVNSPITKKRQLWQKNLRECETKKDDGGNLCSFSVFEIQVGGGGWHCHIYLGYHGDDYGNRKNDGGKILCEGAGTQNRTIKITRKKVKRRQEDSRCFFFATLFFDFYLNRGAYFCNGSLFLNLFL